MISNNDFVEHAKVFGNMYGTARSNIKKKLEANIDIILEIDWQGARQVRENMPNSISIFILPPSKNVLLQRLTDRGEDDEETISKRMKNSESEMSLSSLKGCTHGIDTHHIEHVFDRWVRPIIVSPCENDCMPNRPAVLVPLVNWHAAAGLEVSSAVLVAS